MTRRDRDDTNAIPAPGNQDDFELHPLAPSERSSIYRVDRSDHSFLEPHTESCIGDSSSLLSANKHDVSSTKSPSSSAQQVERLRYHPSLWRDSYIWMQDYVIACLSLGCIVAIVIVLAVMHHRSLSDWNLPISPNAIVSVFATISKSAMLLTMAEGMGQLKWVYFQRKSQKLRDFEYYDNASRGPWGSLKLITFIGGRHLAASAGALIIVLSLAMDPFAQQVLNYRTRMAVKTNVTAVIGKTMAFDSGMQDIMAANADSDYSYKHEEFASKLIPVNVLRFLQKPLAVPF